MILYGASGHAKVIIDILEANGQKIDFIVDDNPALTELLGYEVRRNTGEYDEAIISIGSCEIRKKVVPSEIIYSVKEGVGGLDEGNIAFKPLPAGKSLALGCVSSVGVTDHVGELLFARRLGARKNALFIEN